jgi:hypothetical protein
VLSATTLTNTELQARGMTQKEPDFFSDHDRASAEGRLFPSCRAFVILVAHWSDVKPPLENLQDSGNARRADRHRHVIYRCRMIYPGIVPGSVRLLA